MKKMFSIFALVLLLGIFASIKKINAEDRTYTDNTSYSITIPSEVTIDSSSGVGTLDLNVQLKSCSNLEVQVSSQNDYKLYLEDDRNHTISYSIADKDKNLVFSNKENTDGTNQEYRINMTVNSQPQYSGDYRDFLIFSLDGKNYQEENNKHQLFFNTNDGSVYTESKWVNEGAQYGIMPEPTRKGYQFQGWYTQSTDGEKVEETNIMGSSDMTVYAHWKANTLTINYHNGGATYIQWEGWNDDYVDGEDVTKFQQETYGKAFSNGVSGLYDTWRWKRTGYKAKGNYWKIGEDGTKEYSDHEGFENAEDCAKYLGVLEEFEKGDVTVDLYPIWIANTYTVQYDKNSDDATGVTSSSKHTYDVEQSLTSNKFSRTGFIFTGWNDKADGSGNHYEDEAKVMNLTSDGTIILYAQWKEVSVQKIDELGIDVQGNDLLVNEEDNDDVLNEKDDLLNDTNSLMTDVNKVYEDDNNSEE